MEVEQSLFPVSLVRWISGPQPGKSSNWLEAGSHQFSQKASRLTSPLALIINIHFRTFVFSYQMNFNAN
jgi:hypothetical protein